MKRNRTLVTLALCATGIAWCSSNDDAGGQAGDQTGGTDGGLHASRISMLNWTPCDDNAELDCATLSVPMNYTTHVAWTSSGRG